MVTKERIAELRALCEAATPGPWIAADECILIAEDATFIAAARTALPELLDYIAELEKQVEHLEDLHMSCDK